jgi:hypothetical protein
MIVDNIEVKTNLAITARERGKIVDRREGHNIFLDLGREWLAELIGYQNPTSLQTFRDDRVRYFGLGIGGTRQLALINANSPPIGGGGVSGPYVGSNIQTDTDVAVSVLERPVRVSGTNSVYPGIGGDRWIGQIGSADPTTVPNQVAFQRVFTQLDISYGQFTSVPLSEIMMFTSAADPENFQNTGIAYDTFDTLSKTTAIELEVVWTLRF